jgi:hypothetical protein
MVFLSPSPVNTRMPAHLDARAAASPRIKFSKPILHCATIQEGDSLTIGSIPADSWLCAHCCGQPARCHFYYVRSRPDCSNALAAAQLLAEQRPHWMYATFRLCVKPLGHLYGSATLLPLTFARRPEMHAAQRKRHAPTCNTCRACSSTP